MLKLIHTKNLKWVDITNPEDSDILYLKENFKFHPLDLEDVVTPSTRIRIDEYDHYHFIILLFPVLDKNTGDIKPAEVDFFVGKNYLITIHDGSIKTLSNLVSNVTQYDGPRTQYLTQGSGYLLFSILELLFKRSFPILDQINKEMEGAGKNIFSLDNATLERLSRIKKNIIMYRRIMKMHKYVLSRLTKKSKEYMIFKDYKACFQNLIEYAENIWDVLSSDKESVESYEETNQSLAAHRANDILRILTMFSVIIFLLTLIINLIMLILDISKFPGLGWAQPMVFVSLILMAVSMLLYFKNMKWF
jgi:magnesium transporter